MRACLPVFLLISLFVGFVCSDANAGKRLAEVQALTLLQARIQKDNLYTEWTSMSCLSFLVEVKTSVYFDLAIREKHGDSCPGDPDTAPIVDRFRVNRTTKKVLWYDPILDEFLPYKAVLRSKLPR